MKFLLGLMSRKNQYIGAGFIFVVLFLLGWYHAAKGGFNLTDEGLYLSAPFRYSQGALPFRDAIHNATRQYDLLMAPVFTLYPHITLLEYRIFGVFLHLSAIIAVFVLFCRFFPPIVVVVFCAVFFLINNFAGLPTPSYNVLVSVFAPWAFVLWMYSLIAKSPKKKIILPLLGGVALFFTFVSNMSAGILLLVPLTALCVFWARGNKEYTRATFIFAVTFTICIALSGLILIVSGLMPFFWEALQNDALSSNSSQGGVWFKFIRTWEGIMGSALNSLYIVYIFVGAAIAMLGLVRIKKPLAYVFGVVSLLAFLLLLMPVLFYPAIDFIVVMFSLLCLPIIIVRIQKVSGIERTVFILGTIWSLIQIISYGVLSTNGIQSTVKGAFIYFIIAMISIWRTYEDLPADLYHRRTKQLFLFSFAGIVLTIFCVRGIRHYFDTNYLEVRPGRLTSMFQTTKLRGIYSIPDKIRPLEALLGYLKGKVKPGDYLLAYNDLPMLYYLTDTKPVYPNVWSFEMWWPLAYRQKLFQRMIDTEKTAQYAIHMVTSPGVGWGTPVAEGRSFEQKESGECLLCRYVEKNYVLEKFIFPFEIWRYGVGETNEFLKDFTSVHNEAFESWDKGTSQLTHGKLVRQSPFWLDGVHGIYTKEIIQESSGSGVRFTFNGGSSVYPSSLDIGYYSDRPGFEFVPGYGEEVALTADVRLSVRNPLHPYYSALLYIQDSTGVPSDPQKAMTVEEADQGYPPLIVKDNPLWKTSSVALWEPAWRQYRVTRALRDGATKLNFGITWVPKQAGDYIEIKNMHFYRKQ